MVHDSFPLRLNLIKFSISFSSSTKICGDKFASYFDVNFKCVLVESKLKTNFDVLFIALQCCQHKMYIYGIVLILNLMI